LQPPKSWYCPLLVLPLPTAQPSSTSLMPLWSRPPPLSEALHCHRLLHIVSIQLGHCTPPPSPPPSPTSYPAPTPPPSPAPTPALTPAPSPLLSPALSPVPTLAPNPSLLLFIVHCHCLSLSSIISHCVAPPPLSLPLCVGSLWQRSRAALALMPLSSPWASLAPLMAPLMLALPWCSQHCCAPPLQPSSVSLLTSLARPTTPACRVLLGHHCQLIVRYIHCHCSSSSVIICCRPPLSLIVFTPPSVSAIVHWLLLAMLGCSIGVVAFVLPFGVAGSPRGPLDIAVAGLLPACMFWGIGAMEGPSFDSPLSHGPFFDSPLSNSCLEPERLC
jgi:hypothetical protein